MRRKHFMGFVGRVAWLPFLSSGAWAIDPEICANALVTTQINQGLVTTLDWRRSYAVDETSWKLARDKFGATALLYEIPIGVTFESYRDSRDERSIREGVSLSTTSSSWLITSDLGDRADDAYKTCLKEKGKGAALWIYPDKVTDDGLTLVVNYHSGQFGPNKVQIEYVGPGIPNGYTSSVMSEGEDQIPITRPKKGEIRIVARAPRYSLADNVVVIAPPEPLTLVERKGEPVEVNWGHGKDHGEACLYVKADEYIADAHPEILPGAIGVVRAGPKIDYRDNHRTACTPFSSDNWIDGNGSSKDSAGYVRVAGHVRVGVPIAVPQ
jgi:hypothetical protein